MADSPRASLTRFPTVDVSHLFDQGDDRCVDLQCVRTLRCNVLLEGSASATVAIVALLEPHLREPIVWTHPGALQFEPGPAGTMVLEGVSELDSEDQSKMMRWLDDTNGGVQIVCTTTGPLFPLVMQGLFAEALYYRLNSVLLRVQAHRQPQTSACDTLSLP